MLEKKDFGPLALELLEILESHLGVPLRLVQEEGSGTEYQILLFKDQDALALLEFVSELFKAQGFETEVRSYHTEKVMSIEISEYSGGPKESYLISLDSRYLGEVSVRSAGAWVKSLSVGIFLPFWYGESKISDNLSLDPDTLSVLDYGSSQLMEEEPLDREKLEFFLKASGLDKDLKRRHHTLDAFVEVIFQLAKELDMEIYLGPVLPNFVLLNNRKVTALSSINSRVVLAFPFRVNGR